MPLDRLEDGGASAKQLAAKVERQVRFRLLLLLVVVVMVLAVVPLLLLLLLRGALCSTSGGSTRAGGLRIRLLLLLVVLGGAWPCLGRVGACPCRAVTVPPPLSLLVAASRLTRATPSFLSGRCRCCRCHRSC